MEISDQEFKAMMTKAQSFDKEKKSGPSTPKKEQSIDELIRENEETVKLYLREQRDKLYIQELEKKTIAALEHSVRTQNKLIDMLEDKVDSTNRAMMAIVRKLHSTPGGMEDMEKFFPPTHKKSKSPTQKPEGSDDKLPPLISSSDDEEDTPEIECFDKPESVVVPR